MRNKRLIALMACILAPAAGSSFAQGRAPADPQFQALAAPDQSARYTVTFIKSMSLSAFKRSATVVTVTNNSNTTCSVSADWFIKGDNIVLGTNSLVVPGGTSVNFCSRDIPIDIVFCNAIPGLGFSQLEGRVRVASTTGTPCNKIAVDAAVYYTSAADADVLAIRSPKVVRAGAGSNGD